MEYEKVKEWLDNLVRIHKEATEMHYLTNSIRASMVPHSVIIYEGIEVIADIMEIQLIEKEIETEGNYALRYCYFFIYQDTEFIYFSNTRIGDYARAN